MAVSSARDYLCSSLLFGRWSEVSINFLLYSLRIFWFIWDSSYSVFPISLKEKSTFKPMFFTVPQGALQALQELLSSTSDGCTGGGVPMVQCLQLSYLFLFHLSLICCAEAFHSALSSSLGRIVLSIGIDKMCSRKRWVQSLPISSSWTEALKILDRRIIWSSGKCKVRI